MTTTENLEHFRTLFARVRDAYGIEMPSGSPKAERRPPTDELLRDHLAGKIRLGIYTTDAEGRADQLVFDDDKNCPDVVKRILAILDGLGIKAYVETSKSKGYHIRAHFQPAPAADLRKIGAYVARLAGVPDIEVFPKQDRRSGKDGLGNFMWLPLHGESLETGRTAIVDRSNGLAPLADQWEAVQSIPINSLEALANALAIVEEEEKKSGFTGPKTAPPVGKKIVSGKRNGALFSLAGSMNRRGMSQKSIQAALLIENQEKCDPRLSEDEVLEIAKSVSRYEPGNPITNDEAPPSEAEAPTPNAQETPALDFPAEVMTGAAGAFAHLYSSYLEAPKQFFYMAYLTCLGSYLSGSLTIDSEIRAQPRLYTLLLADSADDRKSTAITKTTSFFGESIADFFMCRGVGSAEGLQTLLKGAGKKLLLAFDEFMAFVGKCKIESSVLLPCVNTLFEDNDYESRTKKETALLNNAHLSILAASTIATYERTWSPAFTDIGFNNRLWLVTGKGGRRFSCPKTIPEESKRLARAKLSAVLDHARKHPVMRIADTARELYDDWYLTRPSTIHGKRLDTYALRFMSLLAVNDLKPEVDVETMKKVIALCDHQHHVRQLHDPVDADNVVAGLEEKIRRVLKAKGRATGRELKRALHAYQTGLWSYNAAIDGLIKEGEIAFDKGRKVYFLQPEGCHK
jgi:Primase C terminal 1 (PriCT-1)